MWVFAVARILACPERSRGAFVRAVCLYSDDMRAVVITKPGGPEVLEIQQVETPHPRAGEVLVRVHASALNRADVLQRQGRYPAPPGAPQNIPGLEFAGEVAALGEDATRWRVGQRVFGITDRKSTRLNSSHSSIS